MPTYEYKCQRCGRFEIVQKMSDEPLKKCPVCNVPVVKIITGGSGIIFNGTGFYETDYKGK